MIFLKTFNTNLLFIFIKLMSQFTLFNQSYLWLTTYNMTFVTKQYITTFWIFFKKFFNKNFGLVTSNFVKSLMFWNLNNLNSCLETHTHSVKGRVIGNFNSYIIKYIQPLPTLSFSFHKKMYNTLMFYFLYTLTSFYLSTKSTFKLSYSFILFPFNFNLYTFPNLFYFKLRNY